MICIAKFPNLNSKYKESIVRKRSDEYHVYKGIAERLES